MGNSRYSAEDRKANQDAHEARMAQFEKSEAGARARREQSKETAAGSNGEPDTADQEGNDRGGADQPDQQAMLPGPDLDHESPVDETRRR